MTYKLYNILGLDRNANPSQQDIKKAYKKMAFENHPDKNKGNQEAETKFKEISNAYTTLSDENKKRVYDQVGDEGYNDDGNHNGHSDIFEQFFRRQGGNPFERHFGFGERNENENKKCSTIHKNLNINLEEVYEGISKNLKITITKNCLNCYNCCNNCNGSGTVKQINNMGVFTQIFTSQCDKCNGSGYINANKKSCSDCNGNGSYQKEINAFLNLPPGINEGYNTVFPDMGEQPKTSKQKPGDLILEIKINSHKDFTRKGNDLYYKCDISFIESVIGKDITIPYFKESLKINTNMFGVVHSSKEYLIEGKGLPIVNTTNKGNMFLSFNINYPKIKNNEGIKELENKLIDVFYK